MKIINGNVVEQLKSGVLFHGVNASGAMGAGIAKEIRKKYPQVYTQYMNEPIGSDMLGHVQYVEIGNFIEGKPPLIVANCWTQVYYGNKVPFGKAKQHFSYEAYRQCLRQLILFAKENNTSLHCGHMPGCGNGGGDINETIKLTEKIQMEMDFDQLYAWKLER